MKKLLVLALVAFLLIGCDPAYRLSLDGNDQYVVDLPSGKLTVSAFLGVESIYVLLRFKGLGGKVILRRAGLEMSQGVNKMTEGAWAVNGRTNLAAEYQVTNGDIVAINFTPTVKLRKGDTITVSADGFLVVDGSPVDFPSLTVGLEKLPLKE